MPIQHQTADQRPIRCGKENVFGNAQHRRHLSRHQLTVPPRECAESGTAARVRGLHDAVRLTEDRLHQRTVRETLTARRLDAG